MMSKSLLYLLSLGVLFAAASSAPVSHDVGDWFDHHGGDGDHYDVLDWLDDKYDDAYDSDIYSDHKFHLFLSITKSLRSADFDSTSLARLYKTFLRGVLHKKYVGGKYDFGLRRYDSDDHDNSEEWDDLFDDDDFHYKYDHDLKEEKTKKLFMFYLKFQAHYHAQREIERLISHKQEKARKQFALFTELVTFVEKYRSLRDYTEKFSKFVDMKLAAKFDSFKKCFYHEQCDHDDDHDFDSYRSGEWSQCFAMEGGKDYEDEGKHFELFLKLYKSVRLTSHTWDSHEEYDGFPDSDFYDDHDDDDDNWKDKHPIFRFLGYLHKHLYNNSPYDFGWKQRSFKDQGYEKFLFFAIRAFKELKEERAMKDRQEKLDAIFAHFHKFIRYQEDNERINNAFFKFQKWQEVRENKVKLEEFNSFLEKASLVKDSDSIWSVTDELSQKFDSFFEHKRHDYRYDSYEDSHHGYPFSNYGYKNRRPHWDRDW